MPPAADFSLDAANRSSRRSASMRSIDVFGEGVENIDVWQDIPMKRSSSMSSLHGVETDAVSVWKASSTPVPSDAGAATKPPRFPEKHVINLELIQKHDTISNNSSRSRSRHISLKEKGEGKPTFCDFELQEDRLSATSNLPPMTPRTRRRKLGIPLAQQISLGDITSNPKPLSVAEKRRLRHEELSGSTPSVKETNTKQDTSNPFQSLSERRRSLMNEINHNQSPANAQPNSKIWVEGAFESFDTEQSSSSENSFVCEAPPNMRSLVQQNLKREGKRDSTSRRSVGLSRNILAASPAGERKRAQSPKLRRRSDSESEDVKKQLKEIFTRENSSPSKNDVAENLTKEDSTKKRCRSGSKRTPRVINEEERRKGNVAQLGGRDNCESSSTGRASLRSRCHGKSTKSNSSEDGVTRGGGRSRSRSTLREVEQIKLRDSKTNATSLSVSETKSPSGGMSSRCGSRGRPIRSPRSGRRASLAGSNSASLSPRPGRLPTCPPSPAQSNRGGKRESVNKQTSERSLRRGMRSRSPAKEILSEVSEPGRARSTTPKRSVRHIPKLNAERVPSVPL